MLNYAKKKVVSVDEVQPGRQAFTLRLISMPSRPSFLLNGQRGLTLIEVLVALLVLSIGLLGVAALHLVSLQNAHSSYHTSLASSIALDFEERLWLRLAEIGPGSCLTQADATAIALRLQTIWRTGVAVAPDADGNGAISHVQIPEVSVTAGTVVIPSPPSPPLPAINSLATVPVTVEWTDRRFAADANIFRYQARVPCFNPNAP